MKLILLWIAVIIVSILAGTGAVVILDAIFERFNRGNYEK
jgi:hypothetical protein